MSQSILQASSPNSTDYSRSDLLIMATERFCDRRSHDRLTVDQYKQAFYQLISEIDAKTKREISRLLATCDFTPRAIVIYCALETLDIARPMLQNSNVLTQIDIHQIIDVKGASHGLVLAGRRDLQATAVEKLQALEDSNIDAALHYNPSLSRIQKYLSEKIEKQKVPSNFTTDKIDTSFMQRNDVVETGHFQPTTTHKFDFASYLEDEAEASSKIDSVPNAETAGRTESLASQSGLQSDLLKAAARGGRLDIPDTITATATDQQSTSLPIADFGSALEVAAQAKSRQGMAVLMQKQRGIALATAYKLLDDKSGDTLSVFMKSTGVNAPQANRILLLSQPSIGLSVQNAMRAVRFYNDLNQETCAIAVDQWPKERAEPAKLQPQFEEGRNVRAATAGQPVQPVISRERFQRYAS